MASSPTVTATIAAIDQASPIIDALLKHIHNAGAETDKLAAKSTAALDVHARHLDTLSAKFGRFYGAANEAAAGFAAGFGSHFLREASHVAEEMSALQRKMVAFGGVSKTQAAELRQYADTTAAGSTGGPVGQADLATQLLLNGYKPDQAKALMEPISLYALETGQGLSEAATEFDGHMNMLHRVRDKMGNEISSGAATAEELKNAAEETLGAMSIYFQQMKGKISDVMEFSKVAAPSSNMLKVPEHFMFSEEAVLSQQGIRGEVAGTAVAGFNRRLIGQTAKGRAAMAEAGLHYSDYVSLDPSLLSTEGVEAAFAQRAGTASAAEKAKISSAVDKFHRDHDFDAVNEALINAFSTSGNKGLQNRVAAANAASDITKGAVTGVNEEKFLQDVHDKGVSVGLLQTMFRESANAVMLLAQNIDEVKRIRGNYDAADSHAAYTKAQEEQYDNYAGAKGNLAGAWTGFQAEAFRPLEDPLTHILNAMATGIKEVSSAGDSAKTVFDAVLVSGVAIGGLRTAGTLANIAGGFMKLATGAEEVGPLVGALELLADVPFLPIVAGIGAVAAGFEAFEHRAELWHKFELWKNGDVDAPTTPAEADQLRAKVDLDRKALADHVKAIQDHAVAIDPATRAAREHANEVLRRGLAGAESDPGVVAARARLAEVENHNPRHDESIHEAHNRLVQVQADYAKREATTDSAIDTLHRVIDHVKHTDPLAGDADLQRTQSDLAGMRARLGVAAERDPAFRSLDQHRQAREAELFDWQRQVIAKAVEMVEAERDHLGAPKVTAGDVAMAQQAADAAPTLAADRHRAAVETAQADLDRITAAARRAVEQSADVVKANADAATAADSVRNGPKVRMELDHDTDAANRRRELANEEAKLASYDRSAATAFTVTHPVFTRPTMGLGEAPAFNPNAAAPRTGPAFGLNGPAPDRSADVMSIIRGISADRGPLKVDPVHVSGDVKGTAEVAITQDVKVTASALLLATVARAEHVGASVNLSGKIGDEMGGSNGVRRPPAGGIGHM